MIGLFLVIMTLVQLLAMFAPGQEKYRWLNFGMFIYGFLCCLAQFNILHIALK